MVDADVELIIVLAAAGHVDEVVTRNAVREILVRIWIQIDDLLCRRIEPIGGDNVPGKRISHILAVRREFGAVWIVDSAFGDVAPERIGTYDTACQQTREVSVLKLGSRDREDESVPEAGNSAARRSDAGALPVREPERPVLDERSTHGYTVLILLERSAIIASAIVLPQIRVQLIVL